MPIIYLSPSTQEYNPYVNTGTEEYWMNRLADAMEPILTDSGIRFDRNTPEMTAASSIQASNAGNFDLHLALHSNASGSGNEGSQRGIIAFYFPGSAPGKRAAEFLVKELKTVYPLPSLVRAEPSTTIGEVRRTRAPAVLLELGFHDNPADAAWIVSSIDAMATAIVRALTEYFGIPFFTSSNPRPGVVQLDQGVLSVYGHPSFTTRPIAFLYDGTRITVLNEFDGWYLIRFGDDFGYTAREFIEIAG